MNFEGPLIGLATFLIIGVFHPIVIKTEYYFGTRPWWIFLLLGLGCIAGALFVESTLASALLELFEQKERVKKGWFPKRGEKKK